MVYAPTAPTYRRPVRLAVVGATPLVNVLSSRVTRGWDQELATAEVTVPYPLPDHVRHRSMIRVYMGVGAQPVLRFVGYVTGIDLGMWPGRITLRCEDILALAKYYRPAAELTIAELSDQDAVKAILSDVGIPYQDGLIGGTGKVFGDEESNPRLTWTQDTSALSMIQQIDQVSVFDTDDGLKGIYRTYCDPGGLIRRIPLHPLPADTPRLTFEEGVDLEQGGVSIEAVEPSRVATAAGNGGLAVTVTGTNPWATLSNPAYRLYPLVGVIDGGGTEHDLTGMADYLLQQTIANLMRVEITIRRDDLIGAFETDRIISPHALVDIKALVQSVVTEMSESGGFTQQLGFISYRELNIAEDAIGSDDPFDGGLVPPIGFPPLPEPIDEDAIIPTFNVNQIDRETVLVDGAYTTLFTVVCEDASTSMVGEIVAWAWTAGGGGTPASGTDPRFTVSWVGSLSGATVELEVTDSLGNVASTGPIEITESMGAPARQRALYTAEGSIAAELEGGAWRTDANSGGTVDVVGNGPLWAAGNTVQYGSILTTPDVPESTVGPSFQVTSLWVERDVSTQEMAAGLEDGRVYRSSDGGATWTARTILENTTEDVLQVIISRYTPGQLWALQASTIWLSSDDGLSWTVIREAAVGQSFIALRLSGWRNLVSSTGGPSPLETAEDGTPFTFPSPAPSSITGIAFNVYADEVCCISGDTPPKLYVTDAPGSFTMTAAEVGDLSAYTGAAPYPRNLQHDGSVARQVYAAVGDWAIKSTDFFKADTVHVLRHVGEGAAGSGPIVMIGMGDLGSPTTGAGVWIASSTQLARWTGDAWVEVTPPASAMTRLSVGTDGAVWIARGSLALHVSTDNGATWSTTATPGATVRGLVARSATEAYIATDAALRKTTDGGATWTTLQALSDTGATIGLAVNEILYADITGTGGPDAHWVAVAGGTPEDIALDANGETDTFCFGTRTAETGFVVIHEPSPSPGTDSGVYFIQGTTATFSNPIPLEAPPDFTRYNIVDIGGGTYICQRSDAETGMGMIYRSTNGTSWTSIAGPDASLRIGMPSHDRPGLVVSSDGALFLIGNASAVYRSTDGGVTWADTSAPMAVVASIAASGS